MSILLLLLSACAASPADLQRQGIIPTSISILEESTAAPAISATPRPTKIAQPIQEPSATPAPTRVKPSPTPRPTQTRIILPSPLPTLPPTEVISQPLQAVGFAAASLCPEGCKQEQPGCDIKGNINNEGVRIYHTRHSEWYSRTKISPEKGERWFCTPQEAEANGWRAPRN